MFDRRITTERLSIWKAITGHVLALMLMFGLFGIIFLALIGKVNLTDPTTATFVGTVTGYIINQLARPLSYYFQVARDSFAESDKEKKLDESGKRDEVG